MHKASPALGDIIIKKSVKAKLKHQIQPAYHCSTVWPLDVWVHGQYNSGDFAYISYLAMICFIQGTNARKVISEVHAFFVLQCTVFGRKIKHETDVTAWHGIHFHKSNLRNILVIGKYYVNFQNYQNLMLLTSSDTKRTLMHLFLFTKCAQRELVSICTQSIREHN